MFYTQNTLFNAVKTLSISINNIKHLFYAIKTTDLVLNNIAHTVHIPYPNREL